MKRFPVYMSLLLQVLFLCSCEENLALPQVKQQTYLEVSLPQTHTRTMLSEGDSDSYSMLWNEGDRITVNGILSDPLEAGKAGETSAVFAFRDSLTAPYEVRVGEWLASDVARVSSMQVLHGAEGTVRVPMYGCADKNETVRLKHVAAIVRVPLLDDGSHRVISHICLRSSASNPVSGSVLIPSGKEETRIELIDRQNVICHTPGSECRLSVVQERFLDIPVLPGTCTNGLDATIVASDGQTMHIHLLSGVKVTAGSVYQCPRTVFEPHESASLVISDAASLASFRNRVESGENTLSAVLVSDVVVESGCWDTPLNLFQGTFDGGGHTVSGLKCPMFNELRGVVRNLRLDSQIEVQLPAQADTMWTAILAQRLSAGGGNNAHIGSVSNCSVSGYLKVVNTSTAKENCNVGGIVGYMVRGKVVGCENLAEISVTARESTRRLNVGGIIGRAYSGGAVLTIDSCVSKGSVSVGGTPAVYNVGGLIGESASNSGTDAPNIISNCLSLTAPAVEAEPVSAGSRSGEIAGNSSNPLVNCHFRSSPWVCLL